MRNVTRGTLGRIADWVAPEPTAEDRVRDAAPALLEALKRVMASGALDNRPETQAQALEAIAAPEVTTEGDKA